MRSRAWTRSRQNPPTSEEPGTKVLRPMTAMGGWEGRGRSDTGLLAMVGSEQFKSGEGERLRRQVHTVAAQLVGAGPHRRAFPEVAGDLYHRQVRGIGEEAVPAPVGERADRRAAPDLVVHGPVGGAGG